MKPDYKQLYEQALDKCVEQETLICALRKEGRLLALRGVPFPNSGFEWLMYLQYKVKSLKERVSAFESGEKYVSMTDAYKAQLAEKDKEIKRLAAELAAANARVVTVRNHWSQIFDDMEKEAAKKLNEKECEKKAMEDRALRAEKQRDDKSDKVTELYRELYQVKTELEEEKGKNLKLKAQINRNHENSSVPSSMKLNRKKITNSREKTGKRPGGQLGHEGHGRVWRKPTRTVAIPAPPEYADSPLYVTTGNLISKQLVNLRVDIIVDEYSTPEFRHVVTGRRVHAKFPDGMVNDVSYGGSVKALAFMLNSYYNVPIDKTSDLISELTQGEINLSHGLICGLSKEFSRKTEAEQKRAFADMCLSPVIHADFTTARVNGKKMNVLVCSDGKTVLYFPREHKGFKGIAGSVIEGYQFTIVHDHDKAFYSYGGNHQECLDHVLRYLKNSMENEPHLTWNGKMRELIREIIHFRKHLDPEDARNPDEIDPEKVGALVARYDEILSAAKAEYEYEPPSRYYRDGFNLCKRMAEYRDNHLLFLYDRRVPYSNSLSERLLRIYKRKEHQMMGFRSFGGLECLCNALGVVATLRGQGKNLYESAAEIFDIPADSDSKSA